MPHPRQIHLRQVHLIPAALQIRCPPPPRAFHKRAAGIKISSVKVIIFSIPVELQGIGSFFGLDLGHGMFEVLLEVVAEPHL